MMPTRIDSLRRASRKLVRELGILDLDKNLGGLTPQQCHALIGISEQPAISVSSLAEMLVLSSSAASRLLQAMQEAGFVEYRDGIDKRQKMLFLTSLGEEMVAKIDAFSDAKVAGAFEYLTLAEQEAIICAIEAYSQALERSRLVGKNIRILTLSTSRPLRRQLMWMVENIQKNEFGIPVTEEINACILRAEDDFYYNNSYNFWYAVNEQGLPIGCIGLKEIDAENGELKKLFVEKDFRGKHVAQALLQTLLNAAKKHGMKTIWLGTVDTLHAAHAFYKKSGFTQVNEEKLPRGFEKCPLDSLFFCLHIEEDQT